MTSALEEYAGLILQRDLLRADLVEAIRTSGELRAVNAELLIALKDLFSTHAAGKVPPVRMWQTARAAIAKAEQVRS